MPTAKYLGFADRLTVGDKEFAQGETVTASQAQIADLIARGHSFEGLVDEAVLPAPDEVPDTQPEGAAKAAKRAK